MQHIVLLTVLMALRTVTATLGEAAHYVPALQDILDKEFLQAGDHADIVTEEDDINILVTIVFRTEFEKENKSKLEKEFHSLLKSIFRHLERETVLNIFVVTDLTSLETCKRSVVSVLSLMVTEQIVLGREMVMIQKLKFRFIDMMEVVDKNDENINEMKKYFGHSETEGQEVKHMVDKEGREYEVKFYNKYNHNLFYLSPYISDILPAEKVIQLDLDLVFRVSIHELWELFDQFSNSTIVATAPDLSPHYYHETASYRAANPGSRLGLPPHQGLNVGVALLHLGHMREDKAWQYWREVEGVRTLALKYEYRSNLAAQDWLSLLRWGEPEMVMLLDCTWNKQINNLFNPNIDVLEGEDDVMFTGCRKDAKIVHNNHAAMII